MARIEALIGFLRNFNTRAIVLVHVVSSGLSRGGQAQRRLAALAAQIGSDAYQTDCVVRSGSPALEICRVANDRGIEFICIPWKKKDFLQRTLLGSTTQDVARLADVPLFVYKREEIAQQEEATLETVLYATTFDPSQDRIVPFLRYEGLTARNLYILHVGWRAPDPTTERTRRRTIAAKLGELEAQCRDCFETVSSIAAVGNPKQQILKRARECGADLVVLGKHEQGRPLDNMLGSTAERITHHARASVLIVPAYELGSDAAASSVDASREAAGEAAGDHRAEGREGAC